MTKSKGKNYYCNRELSWLKFNERVLEEAERPNVPLCERLSFVSIFQSNLDEFFMVRIGSLKDQMEMDPKFKENKTGMTAAEQIGAALAQIHELIRRRDAVYFKLMGELEASAGVRLVDFRRLNGKESAALEQYFRKEIAPLLSPILIGKRQPFPFLRNKDIYAAAVLEKKKGRKKWGLIPCGTGVFPRLIPVADGVYMLSEELILHFLPLVFPGYEVKSKSLIRVTRSADIDADALYDEELDYREFMSDLIRRRRRLAPMRIEFSRSLDEEMVKFIRETIKVDRASCFLSGAPLDLSFLSQIQDTLRYHDEFFYPKRIPQRSAAFRDGESLLDQVAEKDKLLSYPFDSITPFLKMLREAASDKSVVSIKMTLYRVAKNSEVVSALMEAAENGKEVLALVELKARFDEENNIAWSRRLEEAGCHVIYGLPGYKVHSKLCLISRMVNGEPQYITQIGTGNYNEKTARLYTDYSLMTANPEIGEDAAAVFRALAMGETVRETNRLMIAPHCLQNRVLEAIDGEIAKAERGEDAYIGIKINSLTDKKIIERLADASRAGVKIDLVVRGICCLLPGVPGETENIRVISIVGRYLEHSRIYIFGRGEDAKVYIASADLMTRNTLRRVEAAAPLLDPDIRRQVLFMFDRMLADNCQARELHPDGSYTPVEQNGMEPVNSQELFFGMAYDQSPEEKND